MMFSLSKMPLVYWAILLIHVVVGWDNRATAVLDSTVGSITGVDQRLDLNLMQHKELLPQANTCL